MLYSIIVLGIISVGVLIFLTFKIKSLLKSANFKIRGFLKFYNQELFGQNINSVIKIWLYAIAANFIFLFIMVFFLTWKTDYNFFIALFPFIWHYMFFRYFLWEKSDIVESK